MTPEREEKIRTRIASGFMFLDPDDARELRDALDEARADRDDAEAALNESWAKRDSLSSAVSELKEARVERDRWLEWSGGQYPDESPGDVIAAYADGTVVLDDSITTWNPVRAAVFFKAERDSLAAACEETATALEAMCAYIDRNNASTGLTSQVERAFSSYAGKSWVPSQDLERALAAVYNSWPVCVAVICDEYLDRSGALLERVREAALEAARK